MKSYVEIIINSILGKKITKGPIIKKKKQKTKQNAQGVKNHLRQWTFQNIKHI